MMLRRTLSLSLVSLLLSLSLWPAAILAAMTTQVTVETNVAGNLVTQTTIWDPATATTTTAAAAAAATTTATAKTGSFTTVFTTTNINGVTVVLTQTVDRATMLATSSAASSSATAKTTTTGTAVSSSLASGLYLSTVTTTNDVGTTVTLTETFTHSSTAASSSSSSTAASSSSSGSGSGSSSSGSSTSTGTAAEETGTRPDPSTDFTEPPVTAVTTLSIDTYVTVTEGTTATYTTARAPTSMWVTVVRQGNTITVQTTFVQRFSSQYSAVASPSVGSIGLGSLTGSVGVIKSAMKKTVSHNEAQHLNMNSFTSILGGLLTVLIWFL